jgi:hypothetical protein
MVIADDAPGVHGRSDGIERLNVGGIVGIRLLQHVKRRCNEQFTGFTYTRFEGRPIKV